MIIASNKITSILDDVNLEKFLFIEMHNPDNGLPVRRIMNYVRDGCDQLKQLVETAKKRSNSLEKEKLLKVLTEEVTYFKTFNDVLFICFNRHQYDTTTLREIVCPKIDLLNSMSKVKSFNNELKAQTEESSKEVNEQSLNKVEQSS